MIGSVVVVDPENTRTIIFSTIPLSDTSIRHYQMSVEAQLFATWFHHQGH